MDPDEYEEYLDGIDAIDPLLRAEVDEPLITSVLIQRLRDENGICVDGCYRASPAPFV